MPHKSFVIPIRDASAAEAELNAFIRSHRVLEMDRKWVDQGANSFWAVWVDYLDAPAESDAAAKRRVDYKEVLSPADFAVFSQLREFRKKVAEGAGTLVRDDPIRMFRSSEISNCVAVAACSPMREHGETVSDRR